MDLDRSQKRDRAEMSQQLKGTDIRVDLGHSVYRRQDRAVDIGEPEIRGEVNLRPSGQNGPLRAGRPCPGAEQRHGDEQARKHRPSKPTHALRRREALEHRIHCFSQAWKSPSLQGSESSWM